MNATDLIKLCINSVRHHRIQKVTNSSRDKQEQQATDTKNAARLSQIFDLVWIEFDIKQVLALDQIQAFKCADKVMKKYLGDDHVYSLADFGAWFAQTDVNETDCLDKAIIKAYVHRQAAKQRVHFRTVPKLVTPQ